jgi:hypothetical protein
METSLPSVTQQNEKFKRYQNNVEREQANQSI